MSTTSTSTPREVLLFTLEAQRYALPAADVRELVRAARLTPLPRAPDVVEGLLNLRGELLPVLDLRRRFRLPQWRWVDHLHLMTAGQSPRRPSPADWVGGLDGIVHLWVSDTRPAAEREALHVAAQNVSGVRRVEELHDIRVTAVERERTQDTASKPLRERTDLKYIAACPRIDRRAG